MEYFYALTDKQQDTVNMYEKELRFHKHQVFIDPKKKETNEVWKELLAKLKEFDRLYVPSFYMLSPDEEELKIRLESLKELRTKLYLIDEKQEIDIDVLLDMLEYVESMKKLRHAQKQREGIQKALEKKQAGEGTYGRPKLNLPDDFEESIRSIMRKEMNHESYRTKIGMKRSTYYKYVKVVKDRWKKEEAHKNS